ncbi:hypothetical protein Tco_0282408 [Tanacetum coccineum]
MDSFPCLEGLVVAANSRSLFDRMMLYFKRETSIDFDFAADLHNLWVQFIDRTNDKKLFITELDIASISDIRMIPVRLYLLLYYVHGDDEVGTWYSDTSPTDIGDDVRRSQSQTSVKKTAIDRSFSRGSTKEADNVKILQSCNGLLLYCSLDNSLYYSGVGLRIAFDPTKSPHYKLVDILIQMSYLLHLEGKLFEWRGSLFLVCLDDFGSSDFTIYEMMIGCSVWIVRHRVHTDDFMTPLPEGWSIRSNVWSIVLGEREQGFDLTGIVEWGWGSTEILKSLMNGRLFECYQALCVIGHSYCRGATVGRAIVGYSVMGISEKLESIKAVEGERIRGSAM